jgi:hypothetical protein
MVDARIEGEYIDGELSEGAACPHIVGPYAEQLESGYAYWYHFNETIEVKYHCIEIGEDTLELNLFVKEGFNQIPYPGAYEVAEAWTTTGDDPFYHPDPILKQWLGGMGDASRIFSMRFG